MRQQSILANGLALWFSLHNTSSQLEAAELTGCDAMKCGPESLMRQKSVVCWRPYALPTHWMTSSRICDVKSAPFSATRERTSMELGLIWGAASTAPILKFMTLNWSCFPALHCPPVMFGPCGIRPFSSTALGRHDMLGHRPPRMVSMHATRKKPLEWPPGVVRRLWIAKLGSIQSASKYS